MNSSHGRRSCLKFQVKYNRSIHRSIFTDIIAPAPIFDNGLSLFCYAGKEDYANLDEYAKTRSNPYNISYEEVCAEVMGPKQKEQLRRMIGFRFKRHESLNLPEEHLQAIEKHLESRVRKLLAIPTRHLKQEKAR